MQDSVKSNAVFLVQRNVKDEHAAAVMCRELEIELRRNVGQECPVVAAVFLEGQSYTVFVGADACEHSALSLGMLCMTYAPVAYAKSGKFASDWTVHNVSHIERQLLSRVADLATI